jgi:hypothetical protein
VSILDQIKTAITGSPMGQAGGFVWPGRNVGPGAVYSDFQRVQNYHRYTNIYWGRFNFAFPYDPVFGKVSEFTTRANLAARNVDTLHSAIWVAPPTPESDDPRMTFFTSELLENSKAHEAIGSNIFDVALYGDGVFRVDIENSKIRVRSVHPTAYFPELDMAKPQEPTAHNIVYPEDSSHTWYRRERFYWNADTLTWWLSVDRFHAESGATQQLEAPADLKVKCCPIIHTYEKRLSGIFWGKPPLVDCERLVAEYASTFIKLSAISDMASTKALLTAPYNAFDDKGNLIWDTSKPYMVDDADMATFDKSKFGWIQPPGMSLVEPLLATLSRLERDTQVSFGLTPAIFGETGTMRDIGAPGLERVNLLMEFTVNRYQTRYNTFLSDLANAARDLAVAWLQADLPTEYKGVAFTWPEFAPESMAEKADTGAKMIAAGASKQESLRYMGVENPAQIVAEANAENAGQFALPHDPYDPENPDPALDDKVDGLFPEGDEG